MKRYISRAGIGVIMLAAAVMLGYQFRDWQESVGERLRRECGSVVDAAGEPRLINMEIAEILETFPSVAEELRAKGFRYASEKWGFLLSLMGRPDWTEARRQALILKREEMIRG